ncbi:hypothetical protein [Xanthomonas phage BUDD]|nr:hypothetical protein [Xanthomonas phage BUDD]
MKKILMVAVLAAVVGMSGCTDAERASWGAFGEQAKVTCYSGNAVIREYNSTGKVMQLDGDGIAFRNAATGKFVRAFADCLVEEQ